MGTKRESLLKSLRLLKLHIADKAADILEQKAKEIEVLTRQQQEAEARAARAEQANRDLSRLLDKTNNELIETKAALKSLQMLDEESR